jgi:hypothetical protein
VFYYYLTGCFVLPWCGGIFLRAWHIPFLILPSSPHNLVIVIIIIIIILSSPKHKTERKRMHTRHIIRTTNERTKKEKTKSRSGRIQVRVWFWVLFGSVQAFGSGVLFYMGIYLNIYIHHLLLSLVYLKGRWVRRSEIFSFLLLNLFFFIFYHSPIFLFFFVPHAGFREGFFVGAELTKREERVSWWVGGVSPFAFICVLFIFFSVTFFIHRTFISLSLSIPLIGYLFGR